MNFEMQRQLSRDAKNKMLEQANEKSSEYRNTEADFRITNLDSSLIGMLPGQPDGKRRYFQLQFHPKKFLTNTIQ